MDGNLLVLCSERPTIDDYGNRIDENRNLLRKNEDGKYTNVEFKEVSVDEEKRVVNAMDLTLPVIPESIRDYKIIYADWETVITSDIKPLQEMIAYSETEEQIPVKLILDSGHNSSMMRKAYSETLTGIERPRIDYSFIAMENFMRLFSNSLHNNSIVSILPTFSKKDSPEVVRARSRVLESFKYNEEMMAKQYKGQAIEILPSISYTELEEVYSKAREEIIKIMSKPYSFEKTDLTDSDEEHGGR